MGLPKPEFANARPVTAVEAAILADEALARAATALRRGQPRAVARSWSRSAAPRPVGPWFEGAVIGACMLACAAGCLMQPFG